MLDMVYFFSVTKFLVRGPYLGRVTIIITILLSFNNDNLMLTAMLQSLSGQEYKTVQCLSVYLTRVLQFNLILSKQHSCGCGQHSSEGGCRHCYTLLP